MRTTLGISLSLGLLAVLGCNLGIPPEFRPRALQEDERRRDTDAPTSPMRPLPTTLESPFLEEGAQPPAAPPTTGPAIGVEQTLRLPLQEVIQRAVANNLDVRVAGYQPAIDQARVVEAEARFDPVFFSNAAFEKRDRLTAGNRVPDPLDPLGTINIDFDRAEIYTFQSGIRQNLSTGGQVEMRYQIQRNDLEPRRFVLNPYYENDLVLQITQPLLRNFGTEINRARILIARNNQRISLLEFRRALEEQLFNLERAYWQLSAALREVRIAEQLLDRTVETGEILFKRRGQDVTRVQISQANASIEIRRAALIRARARVRDLSDQIKQLMNDPNLPVSSSTLVLPASDPIAEPIRFDLNEQIDAAMESRLELAQQQLRVDNADITVKAAKNNLLPQLNLVGSVSAQGLGENASDGFDSQADVNHLSYTLGLQFEVPIGNREARAIYQRTRLQRQQAIDQYRSLIDQVSLDVKTALREVNTTWDEMVATRQARFAAADALRAIQQREEADEPLTPTFVQLKLDTQERLAEAERAEANATAAYNAAIARLERAKGTLLRYNNVLMEEQRVISASIAP